jgi:hypothetical protein
MAIGEPSESRLLTPYGGDQSHFHQLTDYGANAQFSTNAEHGNDVEEIDLPLITENAADWSTVHDPPNTINPRDLTLHRDASSPLTSDAEDDSHCDAVNDENSTTTVEPGVDIDVEKAQEVIGASEGEEEREDEEEAEEEQDDIHHDKTYLTKRAKEDHIAPEARPLNTLAKRTRVKSNAKKAKAEAKVEERFVYAPDREPDISNVRIVYHALDDSDDEVVSKATVGSTYKSSAPVKLPRIKQDDADVEYSFRASTRTVSLFSNVMCNS